MSYGESLTGKDTNFCDLSVGQGVSEDLRKSSIVSLLKKGRNNYEILYRSTRLIDIFRNNPEKDSQE